MRPTHRSKILTGAVAVLTAAVLTLTGCGASDDGGSDAPTTLTLGLLDSPSSMEASAAQWGNSAPYHELVYDTLLRETPEGEPIPNVATEWTLSDDGTLVTFILRDDVVFTDGTELTAEVVKQNLERNATGSGAAASQLTAISSIAAPDDTTLEVTLSAPDPAFLNYLTQAAGLLASPSSFDSPDSATTPVGSGPYILDADETVPQSTYVYTKNPDYWNPEAQNYDEFVIRVLADPATALNAILANEANAVVLGTRDADDEIEASGWTIQFREGSVAGFYVFDRDGVTNPAFADVRVRQAFNHAFDREALLETIEGGNGSVTGQVFPTRSVAYDEALDDYYGYDPEKAKELLAEAGYGSGLTLEVPSVVVFPETVLALMQQQLADIGVTVNYTDAGPTFFEDLLGGQYGSTFFALDQYNDWQHINYMIAPNAQWNIFRNQDPVIDGYIDAVHFGTPEEQDAAVTELNKYLVEQAWFVPWYRTQGAIATDPTTTTIPQADNAVPSVFSYAPAE